MDGASFDGLRSSIDQLILTQRVLLAYLEARPHITQAQPDRPAAAKSSPLVVEQPAEEEPICISDDEGDDIVEPLSKERIDKIKRDVGPFKSTWSDLRNRYPPGQSFFVPLELTDSRKAALAVIGVTGLDAELTVDEAYSQAAMMAAYGVELLRIALDSPEVNRTQAKQASAIFATLCATLTDTLTKHRTAMSKTVSGKVESFKRAQGLSSKPRPESSAPCEPTIKRSGPIVPRQGGRVGGLGTSERVYPYSREHKLERSSPVAAQPDLSAVHARVSPLVSTNADNKKACASIKAALVGTSPAPTLDPNIAAARDASASGASVTKSTGRSMEDPDPGFDRRSIIRGALLRCGLLESDIALYFDSVDEATNIYHDSVWDIWVSWCIERGLDPLARSATNIQAFNSDGNMSGECKSGAIWAVNVVWTIVEGRYCPPKLAQ